MASSDMPEMESREPELQLKEEVYGVFNSSTIYESMQGNWQQVSHVDKFEVAMPLAKQETPLLSIEFKDSDRDVVEELTVKSYKNPVFDKKSMAPFIGEPAKSRSGQWSHLYQLTRARDQLMIDARGKPGRSNLDIAEYRHSVDKLAHQKDKNSYETTTSNKKVIPGSPTTSFSSLFRSKNGEAMEVNRRGKSKQSVLKEIPQDCKGGSSFGLDEGISLREWLKTGNSAMNKAERVSLFRKIVELVENAHSQGVVLLNLCPSSINIMPSNKVQYIGSSAMSRKRQIEHDTSAFSVPGTKKQKVAKDESQYQQTLSTSRRHSGNEATVERDYSVSCASKLVGGREKGSQETGFISEEKWYTCPEQLAQRSHTKSSSNVYCLGLIAFELFCSFDSPDALSVAMLEVHQRIFPPSFLSENPKEAAFIMWLLHPEPSLRPTTREILLADIVRQPEALSSNSELPSIVDRDDEIDKEVLMEFLTSLKGKKEETASKLLEDITFLEADIKEAEKRHLEKTSSIFSPAYKDSDASVNSIFSSSKKETGLVRDLSQVEKAYFSIRSQHTVPEVVRPDTSLLKHTENANCKSNDRLESFFEGLCKFTRYSRFEVRGTVRNGELLNSTSAICSLSFDRDEDYIASAGVSKKIKVFDMGSLLRDNVEHNYPAIEMVNNSKLSCVSWNNYIRNYLASTDYDGAVKIWDASRGMAFSQYKEHQRRAWSVDFSHTDPTKFATGSDDCSVKLWCANDKKSICTLWNPANICCVQFSPFSSHLVAFGSADYKIYGYDLRHTRMPWCTLSDHEKTVSYVKFMDSDTLVSASTDNTLKLWNLNKTNLAGLSSEACSSTFTGHTNEKHFVGLSVRDGYIACGSETNEVFAYHKFLPTPITSQKFGSVNPISGHETKEDHSGLFVSSVCWRRKSNMVVAANSSGSIKILELV